MKAFRKVLFWAHLLLGVGAGLIILVMSVTGVLLTYEKQMLAWAHARTYQISASAAGEKRLPPETLLARVREQAGGRPSAITAAANPSRAVEVALGRERTLFVNGATGEVLSEGSPRAKRFFDAVTAWHRWLGAAGPARDRGKAVTGAANLGFLFIVVSGLYLWWPRKKTRANLRNAVWFRRGRQGKARDFSWHNVIGFWCFLPLLLIVASGVAISYPWANRLVFAAVGETPPARRGPRAPRGGPVFTTGLNAAWARAEQQMPGWRTISATLPGRPDAPVRFTLDRGTGGEPHKRATLEVDRTSGEVTKWEPYAATSRGQRLRSFLRFAHTGEVGGIAGQTVAGVASVGAVVLVWTGFALTWRRFRSWRARRRRGPLQEVEALRLEREPDLEWEPELSR